MVGGEQIKAIAGFGYWLWCRGRMATARTLPLWLLDVMPPEMPHLRACRQQVVEIDRHVGAMESADAQMHDSRRYPSAIIGRNGESGGRRFQRRGG